MGLEKLLEVQHQQIAILEIGFGTGLNALLTALEAENRNLKIDYTGVEAYPVEAEEIQQLNYPEETGEPGAADIFKRMHNSAWETAEIISPFFDLTKQQKRFTEITDSELYDLIYFDAFGARVQPELWTEELFSIMYKALKKNGILVTYAAKGSVRRAMIACGFLVEKLPGPPGKREMLRAVKL